MLTSFLTAFGKPADVLSLNERPRPRPVKSEILLEMLAAPVNPADHVTQAIRGIDFQLLLEMRAWVAWLRPTPASGASFPMRRHYSLLADAATAIRRRGR